MLNNGSDGETAKWANDAPGAEGSIQVLNTYEEDGRTCRRIKFHNSARNTTGSGLYRVCRIEDGTWKLAP